jgi:hypothetical protein
MRLSATLRSSCISRVTGALELFEDDFVHSAAGIDQRGRDDGQRPAFLDIARRTEESLRALQGVGVDTAGQNLAGRRHDRVVGAAETGDRIQQDDDIPAVFDQALGLFDDHFSHLDVAHRRLVEGRGNDLAFDRSLHVGHFLRPLIDQQHDQIAFGMIGGDRMRDVLHQHRLAGSRLSDDQRALALADRSDRSITRGEMSLEVGLSSSILRRDVG